MAEHNGNLRPQPHLVGGEMDYGTDTPAPLGVLADLVAEPMRDASSVLLIGPTAAVLASTHPAATVLVRRVASGRALAASGVRVCVGGLDRLPPDEVADLVIQLDPPGRVLTPDSPGSSHLEVVELAASHVAPGGRLIALVPGSLGHDRAAFIPAPESDDAWWVGTSGYDDRPPNLRQLPRAPTHFVITHNKVPTLAATMDTVRHELAQLADGWLLDLPGRAAPQTAVWSLPGGEGRPTHRDTNSIDARIAALSDELRRKDDQLRAMRTLLEQQLRRVRALEHAIATEHGPLARRTLWLMTAPASRIVEAARSRLRR